MLRLQRFSRLRRWVVGALVGASPAIVGWPAAACDSSSCALVTRGHTGLVPKKALRVDFSVRHTSEDSKLRGSEEVASVLRPKIDFRAGQILPGVHQELRGDQTFVQVDVAYGLGVRTTLLASLPLLAARNYRIAHLGFEADYGTGGIGDVAFGVRQAVGPRLVAGFSVKLPLGRYRDGVDYDGGILDPTLQPGSGAFDLIPSLQCGGRVAALRVDWSLTGFYQRTTANDLGYRFGDQAVAAATLSRGVYRAFAASLQIKYSWNGRGEYRSEGVASTGTTFAYLNPGLSLGLPGRAAVFGYVQLPVYRHVNEMQLAPRVAFLLGVSKTF